MLGITSPDSTVLAVRTWGAEDAPLVVLVHGLGLSVHSWGRLPQLLAADHRVVAYDLRGHGDSAPAAGGDYGLEKHAADLTAVLRAVTSPERRAVVVGHSLGGGIVVHAAHDGGLVDVAGAVFAGSGGSGVTVPGLPTEGLPEVVGARLRRGYLDLLRLTALVARRIRPVRPVADFSVRRAAFSDASPQWAVDRVREDFLRTRRTALARTTLASVSHDGVREADRLTVPTLVLHGTRDPEVPDEEARSLLDRLPDGELVSYEGEAHMLPLVHPEQVAEQVRRWTARTLGAHAA